MTADRAVTSTVEFVLVIAIAATLMSGLIVAASTMADRQNTSVGRSQMEAVGQQVAGGIESADRLHRAGSTDEMALTYDLPERILSSGYSIEISTSPNRVIVTSSVTDESISVPFDSRTSVTTPTSTIDGGDVVVRYDSGTLVVANV